MQHENKLAEVDFILDLLDALPEAVTYLVPVFKDDEIIDFNIRLLNNAAAKYTGKIPILMIGKNILEHQLPSVSSYRDVFEQSLAAYYAAAPQISTYYNAYISSEVNITRKRFKEGVLSYAQKLTPIKAH